MKSNAEVLNMIGLKNRELVLNLFMDIPLLQSDLFRSTEAC